MRTLEVAFRILLMAAFALWFGGFTFYTAFVVPVGTEVLGSARAQGFITQQVTNYLNAVNIAVVALMIAHAWYSRRRRQQVANLVLAFMITAITLSLVLLFWLHALMDGMIDIAEETISDEAAFYQWHRLYLWISTIQWLVCWPWLAMVLYEWSKGEFRELPPRNSNLVRQPS